MSNKWKPVAVNPDEADDFELEPDTVEPDVDTPIKKTQPTNPTAQPQQQGQSSSHGQQAQHGGFFNFSNFISPTIDLSSSFNPILQNEQVREGTFTGGDTLDEPIWQTLHRDLHSIGSRLLSVVWPASLSQLAKVQQHNLLILARDSGINVGIDFQSLSQDAEQGLSNTTLDDGEIKKLDWDLWGPLIFTLTFSVILGLMSPSASSSQVFSGVFAISWMTLGVIAINIQLLGGTISFFNALSTTGYAMFPLLILAVVSIFVKWSFIRFLIYLVVVSWSVYAVTVNLKVHGVMPGRIFLAIYPVGLVYATLGWLCVIT